MDPNYSSFHAVQGLADSSSTPFADYSDKHHPSANNNLTIMQAHHTPGHQSSPHPHPPPPPPSHSSQHVPSILTTPPAGAESSVQDLIARLDDHNNIELCRTIDDIMRLIVKPNPSPSPPCLVNRELIVEFCKCGILSKLEQLISPTATGSDYKVPDRVVHLLCCFSCDHAPNNPLDVTRRNYILSNMRVMSYLDNFAKRAHRNPSLPMQIAASACKVLWNLAHLNDNFRLISSPDEAVRITSMRDLTLHLLHHFSSAFMPLKLSAIGALWAIIDSSIRQTRLKQQQHPQQPPQNNIILDTILDKQCVQLIVQGLSMELKNQSIEQEHVYLLMGTLNSLITDSPRAVKQCNDMHASKILTRLLQTKPHPSVVDRIFQVLTTLLFLNKQEMSIFGVDGITLLAKIILHPSYQSCLLRASLAFAAALHRNGNFTPLSEEMYYKYMQTKPNAEPYEKYLAHAQMIDSIVEPAYIHLCETFFKANPTSSTSFGIALCITSIQQHKPKLQEYLINYKSIDIILTYLTPSSSITPHESLKIQNLALGFIFQLAFESPKIKDYMCRQGVIQLIFNMANIAKLELSSLRALLACLHNNRDASYARSIVDNSQFRKWIFHACISKSDHVPMFALALIEQLCTAGPDILEKFSLYFVNNPHLMQVISRVLSQPQKSLSQPSQSSQSSHAPVGPPQHSLSSHNMPAASHAVKHEAHYNSQAYPPSQQQQQQQHHQQHHGHNTNNNNNYIHQSMPQQFPSSNYSQQQQSQQYQQQSSYQSNDSYPY